MDEEAKANPCHTINSHFTVYINKNPQLLLIVSSWMQSISQIMKLIKEIFKEPPAACDEMKIKWFRDVDDRDKSTCNQFVNSSSKMNCMAI